MRLRANRRAVEPAPTLGFVGGGAFLVFADRWGDFAQYIIVLHSPGVEACSRVVPGQ